MDALQTQGQQYANNYVNSLGANFNPNLTAYGSLFPFAGTGAGQFNPQGTYNTIANNASNYYSNLLNNFNKTQGIYQNQTQNAYNTTSGFLAKNQKAFLDYNNLANQYSANRLMGQNQGQGTGSSSMNNEAQNNLSNENSYNVLSQGLSNQQQNQEAQNTYNTATALNKQQGVSQAQQYNTQMQGDITGQYNTAVNNAYNQYNALGAQYNAQNNQGNLSSFGNPNAASNANSNPTLANKTFA